MCVCNRTYPPPPSWKSLPTPIVRYPLALNCPGSVVNAGKRPPLPPDTHGIGLLCASSAPPSQASDDVMVLKALHVPPALPGRPTYLLPHNGYMLVTRERSEHSHGRRGGKRADRVHVSTATGRAARTSSPRTPGGRRTWCSTRPPRPTAAGPAPPTP